MNNRKSAVDLFDSLAQVYADKFMDMDLYDKALNVFCKTVEKKNPEILELACGPGNITRYIQNKRPDFNILATDLAPNMLEIAKKNVPTAQFLLLDSRKLNTLHKKFDAIVCGFVLPYLPKEEALTLLDEACAMLCSGGVIYISTMEDDYEKSDWVTSSSGKGPATFTWYHEGEYLVNVLTKNGLTIEYLNRQTFPGDEESTKRDLIIIARKK